MKRLPLPTRKEAKALFDSGQLALDRPFSKRVIHEYLMLDFLRPSEGTVPDIDACFIIEALNFQWLEIQTQAWRLRVEPETPDPEHPYLCRYRLTWHEAGQEPLTESIDVDEIYQIGFPLVSGQVLAIMNRDDFLFLEYRVGRCQVRLQPIPLSPQGADGHLQVTPVPEVLDYVQRLAERGEQLQHEAAEAQKDDKTLS